MNTTGQWATAILSLIGAVTVGLDINQKAYDRGWAEAWEAGRVGMEEVPPGYAVQPIDDGIIFDVPVNGAMHPFTASELDAYEIGRQAGIETSIDEVIERTWRGTITVTINGETRELTSDEHSIYTMGYLSGTGDAYDAVIAAGGRDDMMLSGRTQGEHDAYFEGYEIGWEHGEEHVRLGHDADTHGELPLIDEDGNPVPCCQIVVDDWESIYAEHQLDIDAWGAYYSETPEDMTRLWIEAGRPRTYHDAQRSADAVEAYFMEQSRINPENP